MATTNVLLREDIDNLGGRGEVVKVKAGYARNYLLPRGLALLATKGNVKQVEAEKVALLKKRAAEKATAELQADQMKDISLEFVRKAGEEGTLFGSVTSMDIAEALQAKGYEIDRRKITLKQPIKIVGEYAIPVKLHADVTLNVPVNVAPEGGAPAEAKAEVAEEVVTEVKEEKTETSAETAEA